MILAEASPILETLDYRTLGGEAARRDLVELGIPKLVPGATGIVAALPDSTCVIVPMQKVDGTEVYRAAAKDLS
ncbi:hypothetical protein [Acuticoccus sp.]|uniref:hypothetical protein n=1 Tax=Acuticoccus sp. TaxID=1904378 RepID=UPI003B528C83